MITTPGLESRFMGPPCIYAFYLDPAMDDYPSSSGHWLRRTTSYRVKPHYWANLGPVANLYRISDHRPLRVTLSPG